MVARFGFNSCVTFKPEEIDMANRQQRGNREAKKPKKEKIKVIAAGPSQKASAWQPTLASGKKEIASVIRCIVGKAPPLGSHPQAVGPAPYFEAW